MDARLPYPVMRVQAFPASFRFFSVLLLTASLGLSGCASRALDVVPVAESGEASAVSRYLPPSQQAMDAVTAQVMAEPAPLLVSLEAQREDWQGVPYRYGGLSQKGVDCSGFVYLTFLTRLGMEVPRTTSDLLKEGEPVKRSQLRVGDLVFFRTGPGNRHVGIYMGNGEFLHASTSRGVMTSSMNNPYWRHRYWQARRLVP